MENRKITLRELKATLPSTTGQPIPTYKALRENADIVVKAAADGCRMEVYNNGFAVYSTHGHTAVFRLEWVGNVTYTSEVENWQSSVDVEDEEWPIGVMLYGEDRIEKKSRSRLEERTVPLMDCWDGENEDVKFDAGVDVLAEIISREERSRILRHLTDKQSATVERYIYGGMTQEEIAEDLGISRRYVRTLLAEGMKKIKKIL